MPRHGAVSRGPAGQRPEARAFELDGASEDRAELAAAQESGRLDTIAAGEHGLEALDRQGALFRGEREVERADEITAKAGLLDGDRERASSKLGGLAESLIGEQVQDGGRRGLLLGARGGEQRV